MPSSYLENETWENAIEIFSLFFPTGNNSQPNKVRPKALQSKTVFSDGITIIIFSIVVQNRSHSKGIGMQNMIRACKLFAS